MQKASFTKRFVFPVAIVLITMLASLKIYNASWRIDNDSLHQAVAFICGIVNIGIIWFGASIVFPWAYFRGAGTAERVVGSLTTPVIWDLMEIVRVTEFFTLGESFYYGLNSMFLVTVAMTMAQMGLWEMICRYIGKIKGVATVNIVSPGPVISIVLGIVGIYVFLIWGVGVHWFYIYQQGYKALFL